MSKMSPAEMDQFSKKLEGFASGLTDNERTLFKQMFLLDRGGLSDKDLDGVVGGTASYDRVFTGYSFQAYAPQLNASFFKFLCW